MGPTRERIREVQVEHGWCVCGEFLAAPTAKSRADIDFFLSSSTPTFFFSFILALMSFFRSLFHMVRVCTYMSLILPSQAACTTTNLAPLG